jgi:hypothetical protein
MILSALLGELADFAVILGATLVHAPRVSSLISEGPWL